MAKLAGFVKLLYAVFLASAFGFSVGGVAATADPGWCLAAFLSGASLSARLVRVYIGCHETSLD